MLNFNGFTLPISVCDGHQAHIDKMFSKIPRDADVIHDYNGLVGFIRAAECDLQNRLSDSDQEPIVVTVMENFEIEVAQPFAETQYWIFEIEIAFEQGNWSIVNILCEQVPEPSIEDLVNRLLG